jgi:hypothetical protein
MTPEDRIEELEAALRRIVDWTHAYPVEVFPVVTEEYARRAHEILTGKGMTLDRLSAHAVRHCLTGVRRIATSALEAAE